MSVRLRIYPRRFGTLRFGIVELAWGRWFPNMPFMVSLYLGQKHAWHWRACSPSPWCVVWLGIWRE